MGMSAAEAKAYQRLLDAMRVIISQTDPANLTVDHYRDLVGEYLDFSDLVSDAVEALLETMMLEMLLSPGTEPASGPSPVPAGPYLF